LAVDESGVIIVGDSGNNRIVILSPGSYNIFNHFSYLFSLSLHERRSSVLMTRFLPTLLSYTILLLSVVVFSQTFSLIVLHVFFCSTEGTFLRSFGSWGSGDGEFKGMEGVAVTPNGNILVCDRENHRVQVF